MIQLSLQTRKEWALCMITSQIHHQDSFALNYSHLLARFTWTFFSFSLLWDLLVKAGLGGEGI